MAKLVVIGALALDRPVRLDGPLAPGARLKGRSLEGALAGRLGGGGANAGVALAKAGHQVRLASFVADDEDGGHAMRLAEAAGLDVSLVHRRTGASRKTLIFVDPAGERAVIHIDPPAAIVMPTLSLPEGPVEALYVRAPFPGAGAWAAACQGPVIAHWPCHGFAGPCDVLVASVDDCDAATLADPFAAGHAQVGERLTAFVMTHGKAAVVAHSANVEIRVEPAVLSAKDATGAGDVFAAGLLDALVAGAELRAALIHACAWGAITVGLESSAPVDGVFESFSPAAP